MNTKKRISLILAAMMSLSILATGCKKTDEVGSALNQTESTPIVSELTEMTTTTTEATTTTAPETEPETETETETEAETEETTVTTEETTVTSEETEATSETKAETTAAREWNETELSEVMYVTQACYSRVKAIVGSDPVSQYQKGTKVNVVAATDTGYYKLADGSFIHSDYLTDEKPAATTTTKPSSDNGGEEIFDDDSGSTGSDLPPVSSSNYNKSYKDRYAYKQLSSTEQELYRNIVKAVENFEPYAEVPDGMLSSDIKKVYINVFNQEPQLFWMSSAINAGYSSIALSYEYSREEAASMQKKLDSSAANIISAANKYSSTTSKLKVFYDWIIKNNDFEKTGSSAGGSCSVYNGLTGSTIQCLGYAKSMQYLCDLAGIECMVVTGTPAKGGSHAWNVVYCDNGYYNLDSTWGDPIGAPGGSNYIRYSFFLVPDEWLTKTHLDVNIFKFNNGSSVKLFDPPSCTKTACNYFKAYGKEFSDLKSADAAMYEAFDTAVKNGKNVAEIRVTSYDLFETLMDDKHAVAYQKYAKGLSSKVSKLARQRSDNEGVYVVQYNIIYN